MPSDYSDEHIKQMTDPKHDQSAFKPKIYESPDGGKTVFERDFFAPHTDRRLYHPQELLTKKILPPDVFYKLFRSEKIS